MAALTNTVTTQQMCAGLDREFIRMFDQENDRLMEILGVFGTEVMAADTALFQYKVTGALNTATVAEGDEVPLSQYALEKIPVGSLTVKPYRKLTTAQAILKSGFTNAVGRTDDRMVKDVRADRLAEFFAFLANGTSTAEGKTLQASLAQIDAVLNDKLESHGDSADRIIHFVNRFDIADYLANAAITTQTVYGMTYLESFLGVNDIFVTSKVGKGTIYATPVDNIHIYGADFAELADAGMSYTQSASGLIGVHHQPAYNRTSAETYILTGMTIMPEITDYIVEGTVGEVDLDSMTVDELKAYAAKRNIDITGKTTKAEILAVIKAA